MNKIHIERLTGRDILPVISDLAALRIEIFKEFPYLYEGSFAYEQKYLQRYTTSEKTIVVIALDGKNIVGASTGMPLADEDEMVKKPFKDRGLPIEDWFYFGESVLKKSYRGAGIGVKFFEEREDHAISHGFRNTAFCAVDRAKDHPLRPADYQPLDKFWIKRGYLKIPDMKAIFTWKDLDGSAETPKSLTFWVRHHNN